MADTILASESFPYSGAFRTTTWPRGITPSGASTEARNGYGRFTTAALGNYSSAGAITRRFNYADSRGRDVELRVDFRFPSTREAVVRLYARNGTPTIQLQYGYWLEMQSATGLIGIRGTANPVSANVGAFSAGRPYTARFRLTGTLLRAKVWRRDATEPDWQLVTNDTRWAGSGDVAGGIAVFPGKAVQATYFDVIGISSRTATDEVPAQPTVSAGPNAIAQVGNLYARTATARGTGALRWAWTMLARPSGSTATLQGGTPTVRFTPDVVGNYTLGVVVTDPIGQASVRQQFTLTATARSAMGGKLLMGDDGALIAARHRVCLPSGAWSK